MPRPAIHEHPYRDAILSELHARPLDLIEAETRVRRLVFTVSPRPGSMLDAIAAYRHFAARHGYPVEQEDTRRFSFGIDGRQVSWEFHTEFITVTWRACLHDGENWPPGIGLETLSEEQLVGAMRADVLDEENLPQRVFPSFRENSLCFVSVEYQKAQLATDFVPDRDKFVRFELSAGNLSPLRRSIMLRRILEIETYRNMVLLALPLARETAPSLRSAEAELTRLVEGLSELATLEEVKDRLYALHALFVRAGQISEKIDYRFSAARAYGGILRHRLEKIREQALGQGLSVSSFVENRVEPALATCAAMEKRLANLSEKLARAIDILDVRIGLDIQIQNTAVLETIAETAKSQFKLQHAIDDGREDRGHPPQAENHDRGDEIDPWRHGLHDVQDRTQPGLDLGPARGEDAERHGDDHRDQHGDGHQAHGLHGFPPEVHHEAEPQREQRNQPHAIAEQQPSARCHGKDDDIGRRIEQRRLQADDGPVHHLRDCVEEGVEIPVQPVDAGGEPGAR